MPRARRRRRSCRRGRGRGAGAGVVADAGAGSEATATGGPRLHVRGADLSADFCSAASARLPFFSASRASFTRTSSAAFSASARRRPRPSPPRHAVRARAVRRRSSVPRRASPPPLHARRARRSRAVFRRPSSCRPRPGALRRASFPRLPARPCSPASVRLRSSSLPSAASFLSSSAFFFAAFLSSTACFASRSFLFLELPLLRPLTRRHHHGLWLGRLCVGAGLVFVLLLLFLLRRHRRGVGNHARQECDGESFRHCHHLLVCGFTWTPTASHAW